MGFSRASLLVLSAGAWAFAAEGEPAPAAPPAAPAAAASSGAAQTTPAAEAGVPSPAEAKILDSLRQWFLHLNHQLERSQIEHRRRRGGRVSVVAAVRGDPLAVAAVQGDIRVPVTSADAARPYWKDGWSEKKTAERDRERAELAAAVAAILGGKLEEGAGKLDAFEKQHPASTLIAEARAARVKLAELGGPVVPAPAATPAPQPAAEKPPAAEPKPAEPPAETKPAETPAAPVPVSEAAPSAPGR